MDTDVIVVGAGPTGLMLAADLAERGVGVTILERRHHDNPNITRAFGVHAMTLETLDIRGIADELVQTGAKVSKLRLFDKIRLDLGVLRSRFPYLLITPQSQTERVLRERADRLEVGILSGSHVTGFTQDDQGVAVQVRTGDGDDVEHRARYLVGTDGIDSTVRTVLGLPFPGESVLKSIMLADVRLTTPPHDVLSVNAVGDGFAFVAPFGDGWYRVFAWDRRNQVADDAPLHLDEIREVTRRALGTDLGMHDPRWISRFHSDERQVPEYRVGRVFLAGDAAHVHSPAGGQGMNTGIQDAANLGWKLAAVIQGEAKDALLDSYHDERYPVGRLVLRSSGMLIRMAMLENRVARRLRNTLGGLALRVPTVARRAAGIVSGIGVRYEAPPGADKRVGTRVADLSVKGGRLAEYLRGGHFVLVANERPSGLPEHVRHVRPSEPLAKPILIRPDGYIGWVGDPTAYPYFATATGDAQDSAREGATLLRP